MYSELNIDGEMQPIVTDDFADDRLCPVTGELCVARSLIVDMYTADHGEVDDLQGFHANSLIARMQTKLWENARRAEAINCEGGDPCPVRVEQDNDRTRVVAVKLFRRIRKVKNAMELEE